MNNEELIKYLVEYLSNSVEHGECFVDIEEIDELILKTETLLNALYIQRREIKYG